MPGKDKNVTLSKQIGGSFTFLTAITIAKAHSLERQYSQYRRCRITKQPATIMFCTYLGKVFKSSPTYKQIQTRPVTRGSTLGEQIKTLQQISYKYGAKQRSEGMVVDVTVGFLGVFKEPQAWCTHIHLSHALQESLTLLWHCYTQHHSSPDLFFTNFLSGHCLSSYTVMHSHHLLDDQIPNLQGPSGCVPFLFLSLLSYLLKPNTLFSLLSSVISSLLVYSKGFHTAWSEFLKRSKIRM